MSNPTVLNTGIFSSSFERYIRICYYCQLRSSSLLTEDNLKWYKLFLVLFPALFYVPKFFEVRVQDTEEVDLRALPQAGAHAQEARDAQAAGEEVWRGRGTRSR